MKTWNEVDDFGHYGIFDDPNCFYDNVRELLEHDLKSGKDFDTGWHGFKKEIESMRIHAVNETLFIEVWAAMDDMPDLIYDCDGGEELTEDQEKIVQSIWDANELWTKTEDVRTVELPRNSTIDEIVKVAEVAVEEIHSELDEYFEFLEGTVKGILENEKKGSAK